MLTLIIVKHLQDIKSAVGDKENETGCLLMFALGCDFVLLMSILFGIYYYIVSVGG